ncbi:hypothetical protein BH10PSE12_BH10PSE12_08600 [soil metagenome]
MPKLHASPNANIETARERLSEQGVMLLLPHNAKGTATVAAAMLLAGNAPAQPPAPAIVAHKAQHFKIAPDRGGFSIIAVKPVADVTGEQTIVPLGNAIHIDRSILVRLTPRNTGNQP